MKVRLTIATHSARESRARFVEVNRGGAREVAHRCADAAGEHEAERRRACRDDRQSPLQVRRVADRVAQLVDGLGKLFTFRLEVARI